MLYGNVAAGGVVNLITKKPRFDFGGSVGLSGGSWNSYKPTVDFYGPLTEKIAFRVNGAYETAESFRDVVESQKYYFNPSFLFNYGFCNLIQRFIIIKCNCLNKPIKQFSIHINHLAPSEL